MKLADRRGNIEECSSGQDRCGIFFTMDAADLT